MRERKWLKSCLKRKNIIYSILASKTLAFCFKWFHIVMGVWLGFFFFTLKCLKNQIWDQEEIGFRVNFGFLIDFLHFWRLTIGLKMLLGCFSGILSWKWVSKRKKPATLIFRPLWWPESRYAKRHIFFLKKISWGERHIVCPII
jgi:hypothetical protein